MPRVSRPLLILAVLGVILIFHSLLSSSHISTDVTDASTNTGAQSLHHPLRGSNVRLSPQTNLELDSRGLLTFDPAKHDKHPIELLIERAKKQVAAIDSRVTEVMSLDDAVDEYENEWGMKPPRGFEEWYSFTQSGPLPHPIAVAPLLPFAHEPMLAFLSIPASILRERVETERDMEPIFTFTFLPNGKGDVGTACKSDEDWFPEDWHSRGRGHVKIQGPWAWSWRCNNTLSLLLPILPLLPQELFTMDPPLELAFSADDGPRGMIHSSFRERSENLGKAGRVWPEAQLKNAEQAMRWTYGWQWACPEDSPLRGRSTDMVLNDIHMDQSASQSGPEKAFIGDFYMGADFCYNPDFMKLHSATLTDQFVAAVNLVPVVSTCRTLYNSDIVGVPLDAVYEEVGLVTWDRKVHDKAYWRGSATGLFHKQGLPWRQSQRERLHFFANNKSEDTTPVLIDRTVENGGVVVEEWPVQELNARWLDIGLAGGPVQCSNEDGTCDQMAEEIDFMPFVNKGEALKYKFVVDVDGNGWSSRFRRLLLGNNVVLKSTLFPEWFSDILIPWYHYVPVRLDYSDIYDIMAFFNGAPDGSTEGRDDLAEEIAANALRFAKDQWRLEDMQSYMFLLILEYWRVMSDDREAMSYHS